MKEATVPDGAAFKAVVKKLVTNATFRNSALQNPTLITKNYPSLTLHQLETLRKCAALSGANIAAINKIRAGAMTPDPGGTDPGVGAIVVGGHTIGIGPTCCCCCCCL